MMSSILNIASITSNILGCIFCILCLLSMFQLYNPMGTMWIPFILCCVFGMISNALSPSKSISKESKDERVYKATTTKIYEDGGIDGIEGYSSGKPMYL